MLSSRGLFLLALGGLAKRTDKACLLPGRFIVGYGVHLLSFRFLLLRHVRTVSVVWVVRQISERRDWLGWKTRRCAW